MEIRLKAPDIYLDNRIQGAATGAGCYASIKWVTPNQARFVLVVKAGSKAQASFAAHDKVIRTLLDQHPSAIVRTAIAVFNGLDDFEAQKAGALA